jgi:hypothetical protein
MTPTKLLPSLLLALAMAAPAAAQGTASLQACRALTDPAARLACYDALPLPAAAPAPAPAATAAPAAAVPAAPAAAAATAQSNFGLEAKAAQDAPDAVDSTIEGRFEGWGSKTRIKLANGQVWEVSDGSQGVLNLSNPKVRVRRGVFGAFYMDIEGTNRSPKVRRVQ